jgi:hypothetical protein
MAHRKAEQALCRNRQELGGGIATPSALPRTWSTQSPVPFKRPRYATASQKDGERQARASNSGRFRRAGLNDGR